MDDKMTKERTGERYADSNVRPARRSYAMNLWECAHPGCKSKACGTGGAIGLRAIGWYFRPGVRLEDNFCFCPAHRPDGIPCADQDTPDDEKPETCSMCAAEAEAEYWQDRMQIEYGRTPFKTSSSPEPRLMPL